MGPLIKMKPKNKPLELALELVKELAKSQVDGGQTTVCYSSSHEEMARNLAAEMKETNHLVRDNMPDRITIKLTEREAELVKALSDATHHQGHTRAVWRALRDIGFYGQCYHHFNYGGFPRGQKVGDSDTYTVAERTADGIALTMDRDVAVTLQHLLVCVRPIGELSSIMWKMVYAGVYIPCSDRPRFTGTIRWRKKLVSFHECVEGRTYRCARKNDGCDPYFEEVE